MKLSHNNMDCISQLPDCILSHILTMLPMKDLLKTSILSRRWCRLWPLRRDLYFDIHNVLGSDIELLETGDLIDLPRDSTVVCFADFDLSRDKLVNRVDQFVKNFEGTKIDSFLVNFYLDCEQSNNIDQWISFAIARGVERIDLLFLGRPYAHLGPSPKRYKFSFDLFSKTNASTLKHLHLQNCLVCHITNCDFILFRNLRSLTLGSTTVDELFITSLVSNLGLLDELHLIYCEFKSSMPKIVSSSLCHLEVKNCHVVSNNIKKGVNLCSLDCLKLTSLEYFGPGLETFYINTPMLKRIRIPVISNEYVNAFALLSTLTELDILQLDIYSMVKPMLKMTQPLKHLKQLNFIIQWSPWDILSDLEFDLLWILNILQTFPHLQKLSIMLTYPKIIKKQKAVKDVEICSHDEIRVIELGGCVGNWYEIELVMNALKYAQKLERIVLSPYRGEHDSVDWKSDPPLWSQNGCQRISEKLQGEDVVGREKVVFI